MLIAGKLPINAATTDVPAELKADYGVSFDAFDEVRERTAGGRSGHCSIGLDDLRSVAVGHRRQSDDLSSEGAGHRRQSVVEMT